MRKEKDYTIHLLVFIFLLAVLFNLPACYKTYNDHNNLNKHACRWSECPYKGIIKIQWDDEVFRVTGERHTDAWGYDMLHLEYPNDSYDDLEVKMMSR